MDPQTLDIKPMPEGQHCHGGKTGRLAPTVTPAEITEALKLAPTGIIDPSKQTMMWEFAVGGEVCGIWDFLTGREYLRWSTCGPLHIFETLFPGRAFPDYTMAELEEMLEASRKAPAQRKANPKHACLAVEHSNRFRRVADRYPRRVAEAYGGDIARAAADDDATVAANVRGWEIANGIEPRDWPAWGREHDGKD